MGPGQLGRAHGAKSYRIDPVDVVGDSREDRGLVVVVAAEGGPEADHAMHFPLAVSPLAVQRSSGVSLRKARVPSGGGRELGREMGGDGRGKGSPLAPHVCSRLISFRCNSPCSPTSPHGHSSRNLTRADLRPFCAPGTELGTSYASSHASLTKTEEVSIVRIPVLLKRENQSPRRLCRRLAKEPRSHPTVTMPRARPPPAISTHEEGLSWGGSLCGGREFRGTV